MEQFRIVINQMQSTGEQLCYTHSFLSFYPEFYPTCRTNTAHLSDLEECMRWNIETTSISHCFKNKATVTNHLEIRTTTLLICSAKFQQNNISRHKNFPHLSKQKKRDIHPQASFQQTNYRSWHNGLANCVQLFIYLFFKNIKFVYSIARSTCIKARSFSIPFQSIR